MTRILHWMITISIALPGLKDTFKNSSINSTYFFAIVWPGNNNLKIKPFVAVIFQTNLLEMHTNILNMACLSQSLCQSRGMFTLGIINKCVKVRPSESDPFISATYSAELISAMLPLRYERPLLPLRPTSQFPERARMVLFWHPGYRCRKRFVAKPFI
jgi:hypothetical protein